MNSDIAAVFTGTSRWAVIEGEALATLQAMPDASVDAVVTDPPAGIGFIGKEWDDFRRARNHADVGRDSVFGRTSRTGPEIGRRDRAAFIAFLSPILAECYRVAKPGARMFCWAIPRTCGWTQIAIEDAGWIVESAVGHLFGSGFPKGKGQLKPAMELWFLARKPGGKVPPLQIDACRVETGDNLNGGAYSPEGRASTLPGDVREGASLGMLRPGAKPLHGYKQPAGRWPPNLLLSHAPGCREVGIRRVKPIGATAHQAHHAVEGIAHGTTPHEHAGYRDADGLETVAAWECVDGCPVKALDEQSGERPISGSARNGRPAMSTNDGERIAYGAGLGRQGALHNDDGTASRFFPQFAPDTLDGPPFLYAAKASRRERNAGCEGLPERVVSVWGGDEDDLTAGKKSTVAKGNHHPTVKPQALMRWLCRLITPPGGIVLDPFAGSGSTGVAALAERMRFIGIERESAYVEIGRTRCAHADDRPEARKRSTPRPSAAPTKQMALF